MKRSFLFIGFVIFLLLTGCRQNADKDNDEVHEPALSFSNYRDIPGITTLEINIIEKFKNENRVFTYGMPLTTETFLNEDGEIRGFTARFCDWLTGLLEIPFTPVHYELAELIEGLASGDVDFTGELRRTGTRNQVYFMTSPIAERTLKYFCLKNSPSLQQITAVRKPRYGFISGAATADTVTIGLGDSVETVLIHDMSMVYDKLKSGEIDVFFYSSPAESIFAQYTDVSVYDYFPLQFMPVSFATQNSELAPIVSVVQKIINNGGYRYLTWMYNEGYRDYRRNILMLRLTEEEREYMHNNKTIPIVAEHFNYPISFYNKYDKEWQGIYFDIIKELEELTGFTFRLVNDEFTKWPYLLDSLERGEGYMISELLRTNEREGRFLWPDTPIAFGSYALLSKSETRNISLNEVRNVKIGLPQGTAYAEMFRTWFPDHDNYVYYESTDEAFAALENDEVEMVITNQLRLLAITNYHELSGYKANVVFNYPTESFTGFHKNAVHFASIVSKALHLIDVQSISTQWVSQTFDYQGKIAREQRPWLIGAIILILCLFILVFVLLQRRRFEGKKLEDIVKKRTETLDRQLSLMIAVNETAILLLESEAEDYVEAMNKSMEKFCEQIGADRVYLWKNSVKEDGKLCYKQVCKWTKKNYAMSEELREYPYDEVPKWEKILSKGQSINGPLDWVPEGDKEIFNEYTIESLLIVPLFLNYKFWGFASVDDCSRRRIFPEAEERALQTWGLLVMGTIQRGEIAVDMRRTLKQSVELQKELQVAMEAAKAANRSKSAFLANMSHEIRTPMNSIMGFSELAMDGDISEKTRDYLTKINTNAEWLLQIINDILDISKIESGKMELEHIPFDMHELLANCRTLIHPKAAEKGIALHFYAEPSFNKKPLGDPTRLRQVFLNLLTNAVKFTNSGAVKFHAVIKDKTDGTITMHFEIIDSGIGMTKEQAEKVFDPFMQAEIGTTRKYGGTGLGLSITKNIIEMMKGKLLVESTPGIGSKFSFDITFDTLDAADVSVRQIALNEVEKPEFDGEVLLCEDNYMNQQVICEHLARVGLRTVVAENGKIGVDLVNERIKNKKKKFDLIFMDMHMPVMDGLEAAEKILKLNLNIPIIAMTANIMSDDRETYKTSGMHDCVGKPFTSQELWQCLLKYLTPIRRDGINGINQDNDQNIPLESDEEFMEKLEIMFVKSNQHRYEEILKAIEDDIKLAHRLVHTLKTNAGQIGRIALQKAAAEVEQHLENGENKVSKKQMSILKKELEKTLHDLSHLLDAPDSDIIKPDNDQRRLNSESAHELLDEIEPMLKMGNPECSRLLERLMMIPGSEELVQQIEDYDFDRALVTLDKFRKKI